MPSQRPQRRRPVQAVPDQPKRTNGVQYWDMQFRWVLGGEVMHPTDCGTCGAVVPSGSKAQARHAEWHRLLQEAIEAALPR
jgi:hypothetical protein